jgi:pyrroline-5-carboxylate reductase
MEDIGLQEGLGDGTHVIRTMPNTPAMIGEGMTVWSQSAEVTEEQHELVRLL